MLFHTVSKGGVNLLIYSSGLYHLFHVFHLSHIRVKQLREHATHIDLLFLDPVNRLNQ